jgi:DNA-damage-inducible protein J
MNPIKATILRRISSKIVSVVPHCSPRRQTMTQPLTNPIIRARIDGQIKEEAAAVLASIGLTMADAFHLMMVRIAKDKALPFEPLIPNAETIEAMKAARRGDLVAVASPDALLASLNAAD